MADNKRKQNSLGLYLVAKLSLSLRANAYAICFLVHQLYVQLLYFGKDLWRSFR